MSIPARKLELAPPVTLVGVEEEAGPGDQADRLLDRQRSLVLNAENLLSVIGIDRSQTKKTRIRGGTSGIGRYTDKKIGRTVKSVSTDISFGRANGSGEASPLYSRIVRYQEATYRRGPLPVNLGKTALKPTPINPKGFYAFEFIDGELDDPVRRIYRPYPDPEVPSLERPIAHNNEFAISKMEHFAVQLSVLAKAHGTSLLLP